RLVLPRTGRDLVAVALKTAPGHLGDVRIWVVADLPLGLGQLVVTHHHDALDPLQRAAPGQQRAQVRVRGDVVEPRETPAARPRVQAGALVDGEEHAAEPAAGGGRQRGEELIELADRVREPGTGPGRWRAYDGHEPHHDAFE